MFFQLPIVFLNIFGSLGAFIWLLVIGEWRAVVAGIVIAVVSPFLLGLVLLLGAVIGMPAISFARRGATVGLYFFSFLASAYTYSVMVGWCIGVAHYFLDSAGSRNYWPLAIWSYSVATAPWTYMAQQDRGAIASIMAAFFVQAAYVVMLFCLAVGLDVGAASQAFIVVMIIGVVAHMKMLAELNQAGVLAEH